MPVPVVIGHNLIDGTSICDMPQVGFLPCRATVGPGTDSWLLVLLTSSDSDERANATTRDITAELKMGKCRFRCRFTNTITN